jgi:hypothetical protein
VSPVLPPLLPPLLPLLSPVLPLLLPLLPHAPDLHVAALPLQLRVAPVWACG